MSAPKNGTNSESLARDEVAAYFSKKYVLFTGRGCTALYLYLLAKEYSGKSIIVPANICPVVPFTLLSAGCFPLFVDVNLEGTMEISQLSRIESKNAVAVIAVYMYGNLLPYEALEKVCREKNWEIIEDTAQSIGATYKGKYTGSFGDATITSFGVGKHIDLNIGGVLAFNDDVLYKTLLDKLGELPLITGKEYVENCILFNEDFGSKRNLSINEIDFRVLRKILAFNFSPTDEFFDVLRTAIRNIDIQTRLRAEKASIIQKGLEGFHLIKTGHSGNGSYWRFNLLVSKNRDRLLDFLRSKGIKASKYFPPANTIFQETAQQSFPQAEKMGREIVNLWVGPETSLSDAQYFSEEIRHFLETEQETQ